MRWAIANYYMGKAKSKHYMRRAKAKLIVGPIPMGDVSEVEIWTASILVNSVSLDARFHVLSNLIKTGMQTVSLTPATF